MSHDSPHVLNRHSSNVHRGRGSYVSSCPTSDATNENEGGDTDDASKRFGLYRPVAAWSELVLSTGRLCRFEYWNYFQDHFYCVSGPKLGVPFPVYNIVLSPVDTKYN